MRSQQELRVDLAVAEQLADQGETVRVKSARRQAEHGVAGLATRAVDEVLALDDADTRAREVELLRLVDAGQLGRLAPDQRAMGLTAHLRCTLDELGDLLLVDSVGGDVVEQEERVGAAAEDVVDAVRREVHPGPPQLAGTAREHELRADAVRGGGEQAAVVERVKAGERAERLRARRLDGGAQASDDGLCCRERDPRGLIRPPRQESTSLEAGAGV